MSYTFERFAQQGWQCPVCKRVYSPTTPMCYYCGESETITTTHIETGTRMVTPHTTIETPLTKTVSDMIYDLNRNQEKYSNGKDEEK